MLQITKALQSAHTLILSGSYAMAYARLDQAKDMASVSSLRNNHHARSIRGHIAVAQMELDQHMRSIGWDIQ